MIGKTWIQSIGAGLCLLLMAHGQAHPAAGMDALIRQADAGSDVARMNVAMAYESGHGVPHDVERARHYYALAADHGFAPAQGRLGLMYRDGLGSLPDSRQALHWLRLAAGQGDATALRALAQTVSNGQAGLAADAQEAMHLYMRCATEPLHAVWNGRIDLSVMACRSMVGALILEYAEDWETEQHGLLFLHQALASYAEEEQAVQRQPEFAAQLRGTRQTYDEIYAQLTRDEATELQRLLARHDEYFREVRTSLPMPQVLREENPSKEVGTSGKVLGSH